MREFRAVTAFLLRQKRRCWLHCGGAKNMRVIYQPDRIMLDREVKWCSGLLKNGLVLNLGCGSHDRYRQYLEEAGKVLNIDVRISPIVDVVGDAHGLPLKDNSIDSILCTQVFEHLLYPHTAMLEVARVLKPGGIAVISVPQTNELHEEPFDFFRFTKYGLTCLANEAGLEVIELIQRGGFWSVLSQSMIRYFIERCGGYQRKFANYIIWLLAGIVGRIGMWMDRMDKSNANRKFALGWTIVVRKR